MDAGYVAFLKALQYQQGAVRGKLTEGWKFALKDVWFAKSFSRLGHNIGQKNLDMIWVNFISGPDWETVLECEAGMLHGQKSKIGEVFAQVWR